MSDTPDFRDLVGDDLTPEEELELDRVDRLLRSVPAPAAEMPRLTHARGRADRDGQADSGRAAASSWPCRARSHLAALFFGVGRWLDWGGFDAARPFVMTPRTSPDASAKIELPARRRDRQLEMTRRRRRSFPNSTATTTTSSGSPRTASTRAPAATFNVSGRTTVDLTKLRPLRVRRVGHHRGVGLALASRPGYLAAERYDGGRAAPAGGDEGRGQDGRARRDGLVRHPLREELLDGIRVAPDLALSRLAARRETKFMRARAVTVQ